MNVSEDRSNEENRRIGARNDQRRFGVWSLDSRLSTLERSLPDRKISIVGTHREREASDASQTHVRKSKSERRASSGFETVKLDVKIQ